MIGISSAYGGFSAPYLNMRRVQRAQPDIPASPVPPVSPVKPAGRESAPSYTTGSLPVIREGADPVEMAVRGRIQYLDDPNQQAQAADASKSPQEVMEEGECQTCKSRKYQDGSDDPGVSFKTATNIAPEQAAAAVRGHEQEHVVRNQAKAAREGRKVVSQSVTLHTDICPECGDVYVSGGTTRTTTKGKSQPEAPQPEQRAGFQAVA